MSIGYACLTVGVQGANFKTCSLKNCDEEKFISVVRNNLTSLYNILEYNNKNRIKLFRISSDIIPFGSSVHIPVENWNSIFSKEFAQLGELIKKTGIRVSMHPGQYTVLNSISPDVVERAMADLNYHAKFLDLLSVGENNKIILHVGGMYGDKDAALFRFKENYMKLTDSVRSRLVIENDDKLFNIKDVLALGMSLGIPVVYDNLHNACNKASEDKDSFWIKEVARTWKEEDGKQKIHYSQQDMEKRQGAHSKTIQVSEFIDFHNSLTNKDIDIMLEVKDKNISALKCISLVERRDKARYMDTEWARYKYLVLEKSEKHYLAIRKLLRDKDSVDGIELYSSIEEGINLPENKGQFLNAAQHVWGYFKNHADEKEKGMIMVAFNSYLEENISGNIVKKKLWKLALKYRVDYLMDSYYFNEVR